MNIESRGWMCCDLVLDGGVLQAQVGVKDFIFEVLCINWEMVYEWCGLGLGAAVPVRVAQWLNGCISVWRVH